MKKTIVITEEEAKAIVSVLRTNWIPVDLQKTVYNLINKIEKELST